MYQMRQASASNDLALLKEIIWLTLDLPNCDIIYLVFANGINAPKLFQLFVK
jgi:hypothetical protein